MSPSEIYEPLADIMHVSGRARLLKRRTTPGSLWENRVQTARAHLVMMPWWWNRPVTFGHVVSGLVGWAVAPLRAGGDLRAYGGNAVIARPDKIAALATLLLCSPLPCKAYQIAGIGLQSCGPWAAARGAGVVALQMQWVVGYLSGLAFAGQLLLQSGYLNPIDPLDGTDVEAALAWIDNYCRAKPLDQLETAAGAFVFAHPRWTHPAAR